MLKLTRFLILIAVALTAARPVMACCFTGHGVSHMTEAAAEASPCHGEQQGAEQHAPTPSDAANLFDCPGCADCNIAVANTSVSVPDAVLAAGALEIPFTALSTHFEAREFTPLALKTGPPGAPPALRSTPVSLKQRLLI